MHSKASTAKSLERTHGLPNEVHDAAKAKLLSSDQETATRTEVFTQAFRKHFQVPADALSITNRITQTQHQRVAA